MTLPLPECPLTAIELLRDPYVLLVAPDSPFAGRAAAPSLAEIAQLPLIAWRSWLGVEDSMRERGYELNVIMRSDDSDTVRSLVAAGVGAAIVPRLIVDPGGEPRAARTRRRLRRAHPRAGLASRAAPHAGTGRIHGARALVCASDLVSRLRGRALRRG